MREAGAGRPCWPWESASTWRCSGYFKYRDFLVGSVNGVLGSNWTLLHMALPLAISFFSFEQITYLMSCYRGEEGTGDFISYAMFITFFPHLIAGPIVRYREIYPQFNRHSAFRLLADNLAPGLMIFAIGLFKKVILADTFRDYVGPIYEAHFLPSFADAWGGTLAFALQVYFDFSGYSDMAIGLARMLGVRFPENFDSPYQCDQHDRVLAALAHHAIVLSARLRLYSPGRQPQR